MSHPLQGTRRTYTQLMSIFKDGQPDGSISAEDVRDLIESLTPSMGAGQFTSDIVFTIGTIGLMTSPSSGTSAITNATPDIDMPQDLRIRYIGTTNRHFLITMPITATVGGNNQDLRFQFTRNGTVLPDTITARSWGTGSDGGSLTIMTHLIMSPNDYIEIQAANDTATNNITIINGVTIMHGTIS